MMPRAQSTVTPAQVYAAVGGEEGFGRLVAGFYARVAQDPVLRPLYPDEDLGPATERLTLFLIQYWGGLPWYSQQRGHPRLRMRHAPFAIGEREIAAWLTSMRAAVDDLALEAPIDAALWSYLQRGALMMRNRE